MPPSRRGPSSITEGGIQLVSLNRLPYCHIASATPARHTSQNTISHLADGFRIDRSGIGISLNGCPPAGPTLDFDQSPLATGLPPSCRARIRDGIRVSRRPGCSLPGKAAASCYGEVRAFRASHAALNSALAVSMFLAEPMGNPAVSSHYRSSVVPYRPLCRFALRSFLGGLQPANLYVRPHGRDLPSQQLVVSGIHPDTRKPYTRHGGEPSSMVASRSKTGTRT